MDINVDSEWIMRQLIKHMKTQTAVAKALGKSKQVFNYWLNHSNKVPFDQYLSMKILLKHYTNPKDKVILSATDESELVVTSQSLAISQRVFLALEYVKKNKQKKQGSMHKEIENNLSKDRNCDKSLKGRIDTIVALRYGFHSKDTYLRAKKVVLSGIPNLIEAMDQDQISIYQAAQIAQFEPPQQFELLSKSKKEITAYIKKIKSEFSINSKKHSKENLALYIKSIKTIYHNKKLILAEETKKYPLRSLLIGLFALCDEKGKFHWNLNELKSFVFPHISFNFCEALNFLILLGFICKKEANGNFYGYIQTNLLND